MVPLAFSAPRILLGSAWNIWLRATDAAVGCLKVTTPSLEILKLLQFRVTFAEVWEMVSWLPCCTAVALPEDTQAVALVPQLPATHGTGNSVGGAAGAAPAHNARMVRRST